MLSYIIPSRNDNHCGDAVARLGNCLKALAELQPSAEILVVDWGSDSPLSLEFDGVFPVPIHFIEVPAGIAQTYPVNIFPEVLMFNIGIRRASGDWIATLEADVMIGKRYAKWVDRMMRDASAPQTAYESLRREMTPDGQSPIWSDWPVDHPLWYRGARGILLAPAARWMETKGYDERLIYWNHVEHDLCIRFKNLCGLVNLGVITNCDFYHQFHERPTGRPDNLAPDVAFLEQIDYRVCETNPDRWGMPNASFPMVTTV